jgi:predicted small lipoprotein YifL
MVLTCGPWRARQEAGGAPVAPRGRSILSPILLIALAAAVGLSACGRKGALEAPPYAAVKTDEAGVKPDTGPQKPNKPFVLDPLL